MREKLVWLYLSCFVGFFFSSMYLFEKHDLWDHWFSESAGVVLGVSLLYAYALSPWALKTRRAILYAWRRVLIVAASFTCSSFITEALKDDSAFVDMIFLCPTLFLLVFVVKIPDDSDNGDESA